MDAMVENRTPVLRQTGLYNACVVEVRPVHEELMILRVRLDEDPIECQAGQYTVLGLGEWEPRIDGVTCETSPKATDGTESAADDSTCAGSDRLVRRAYSISSPMLWQDHIAGLDELSFAEFFITLIRRPSDSPPMLTPRLFNLSHGDRLYVGQKAHGQYTLEGVNQDDDVLFLATGTGEAPHNAMSAELLRRGHVGRVAVASCVRYHRDLAYLETHRQLERFFSNYRYFPLTTREPWNTDPAHPEFSGKQYLQDWFVSGALEQFGGRFDPARTHVFLCGSPAMIGLPHRAPDGHPVFPEPLGMAEVLHGLGFTLDSPRVKGNVHVEKYW